MTKPKILSSIIFYRNFDDESLPQSKYPSREDYPLRLEVTLLNNKEENTIEFSNQLEAWLIKNKSEKINFAKNPEEIQFSDNIDFFAIYINNMKSFRDVIVKNFEKFDFKLEGHCIRRLPNEGGIVSAESLYMSGRHFCKTFHLDERMR